jgi:two-component system response regulator QseB
MRVLIVEDDHLLGAGLQTGLGLEGHAASWLRNAELAAQALAAERFDVLILDLGLPDRDGLALLRDLRRDGSELPVLVLTARDGLDDRVSGLDAGADDYVVKPFDLAELAARLRALVRRSSGTASAQLQAGDLTLDTLRREARVAEQALHLSPKEFALLEVLVGQQDRVVPRAQLQNAANGWTRDIDSNALEVHIHNLRRKLGRQRIRTIRGIGYRLSTRSEP